MIGLQTVNNLIQLIIRKLITQERPLYNRQKESERKQLSLKMISANKLYREHE